MFVGYSNVELTVKAFECLPLERFLGEQLKISQFAGLAGEDIPMCFFVLFEY